MPRVSCPKCQKTETIQKSGIVRNKQRFLCKECSYHFTLFHDRKNAKLKSEKIANRQTSLLDIAKAMGVSTSTISRALNNHPDISIKTKKAVNKLAAELSYQPNALAKSFFTRSTHTIGVVIPNLETPFFSSMLCGIQTVASEAGYRVVICQSNETHQTEVANVQALMNNMIDGLLLCHTLHTQTYDHIKVHLKKDIPIVQFYRATTELETSKVYCEDEKGSFQITEHLIRNGCKHIAILLGPAHLNISENRLKGYKQALAKHGLVAEERLIKYVDFSKCSVDGVLSKLLEQKQPIDGIFSISDKTAVQIIQYLKSKNIRVPQDICVAGFGNEYTGEIIDPKLTTYDVRTTSIGEKAAQLLLDKIAAHDHKTEDHIIKGNLIIRQSSDRLTS